MFGRKGFSTSNCLSAVLTAKTRALVMVSDSKRSQDLLKESLGMSEARLKLRHLTRRVEACLKDSNRIQFILNKQHRPCGLTTVLLVFGLFSISTAAPSTTRLLRPPLPKISSPFLF